MNYVDENHVQHLIHVISTKYNSTCEWIGNIVLGYILIWNYTATYVRLSISRYIEKTFQHLNYTSSTKQQFSIQDYIPFTIPLKKTNNPEIKLHLS